ncbi:hypothetical protein HBE96_21935 [Clostridium sp. P21]|uniref:Uncharacterized protein n=1 Tax=Clostridium muellerianum TaxID=2716538 RepID=A0A7Y0EKP8_9CLOT|nr:hypothetical protein [Clostridium muellerianum]NMM65248.1 hypothetical protein [Clostridium muellerianum]
MVIAFWIYGIIGNLFGEKFVWGTGILGFILEVVSLGRLASVIVIIMAPAILRAGYKTLEPILQGLWAFHKLDK